MTDISSKEIQSIISEIVHGFSSIDTKVMELNVVSNQDFTALNKIFKNHHETTKGISQSTSAIIDQVQALNNNALLRKLNAVVGKYRQMLDETGEQVGDFNIEVGTLKTDFKHIFIPILNFKQNISTLRFLLANLKLNQGLVDKEVNRDAKKLIDVLNEKITGIQSEIPVIAADIEELKDQYAAAHKLGTYILQDILPDFDIHSAGLHQHLQAIAASIEKTKVIKHSVEQLTQQGFQNLNEVITNLQYHDIIRQKIEHIQQTHQSIIAELNSLDKAENVIKKGLEYVKQIPEITEIQAGQLLLTNKEYQTAIENTSLKLIETTKTLEEVNAQTERIFGQVDAEKVAEIIRIHLGHVKTCKNQLFENIEKLISVNETLQTHIDKQNLHYQKLAQLENEISSVVKDLNKIITNKDEVKALVSKLVALINDINESRGNIGKIIHVHQNNQLGVIVEELQRRKAAFAPDDISDNEMAEFSGELKHINHQIVNNCTSYAKLDNDLKTTLENIKYYDFYDVEVEAIISQLNFIYKKILQVSGDSEGATDLLSTMKNAYTMKSQRDIHEKAAENEPEEEDEDNLELF
ncbi:MAG: hypothetical protein R6U85_05355 [Salinivirgaceae bacterium]